MGQAPDNPRVGPLWLIALRVIVARLIDLLAVGVQRLGPNVRVSSRAFGEPLLYRPSPVYRSLPWRGLRCVLPISIIGGYPPQAQNVALLGWVVPLVYFLTSGRVVKRPWVLPTVLSHLVCVFGRPVWPVAPVGHFNAKPLQLRLEQFKSPLTPMILGMPLAVLVPYPPLAVPRGPFRSQGK